MAFGFLVLHPTRSALHLPTSGSIITWGALGPEVYLRRRNWWSSEMAVQSKGDASTVAFRLPLTPAGRTEQRVARARDAASAIAEQRARTEAGSWWLRPDALADAGATQAVSVGNTVYLGGLSAHLRHYRKGGRRFLDFDRRGVSLRGFRRQAHVPWVEIARIEIIRSEVWPSVLLVHRSDGGKVRFANAWLGVSELAERLAPVLAEMSHAGQGVRVDT